LLFHLFCHSEHISDVSSAIMKIYIPFHIYIIHIILTMDLFIHEGRFCDRNHGNIFSNKSSILVLCLSV
jgi:hypothetical protein